MPAQVSGGRGNGQIDTTAATIKIIIIVIRLIIVILVINFRMTPLLQSKLSSLSSPLSSTASLLSLIATNGLMQDQSRHLTEFSELKPVYSEHFHVKVIVQFSVNFDQT